MSNTKNTKPAAAQTNLCLCGCGLQVAPRRNWLPGHDARAAGAAARAAQQGDRAPLEALPTEKLRAKAETLAARWTEAAEGKAARAAERAAARAAKESATAEA